MVFTLSESAHATTAELPDRPLRVAIVDEELPYPATSGKRIRTLNLTLRLAKKHRISFLCHRNSAPGEAEAGTDFLARHGIEVVFASRVVPPKTVRVRGPSFYAGLAANLLSPLPYVVSVNYSPALKQLVHDYASRNEIDLWQCEWTPYAQVMRDLPGDRLLVMAHNVESLIWQRYWETEPNPVKRWYIERQWRKFETFERQTFAQAARLVTVSADDAVIARERYGARRVSVVDNGVETDAFRPIDDAPRDYKEILFLGSLDWRPNLDAVRLLFEKLFPAVQAQEPKARLTIVGRNPPEWLVQKAQALPGVELAADVADVRPYLRRCGALAVPLRIGGGSRLKILEALAAETPVVSTRVGAEGLELSDGEHLILVDRIEDMVGALLTHMRCPQPGLTMARNGRQLVCQRYDWDALADKLDRVWRESVAPANRSGKTPLLWKYSA